MYVCMYVCMYACMHVSMYVRVCAGKYVCMHLGIFESIYMHAHVHVHLHTCTYELPLGCIMLPLEVSLCVSFSLTAREGLRCLEGAQHRLHSHKRQLPKTINFRKQCRICFFGSVVQLS